MTTPLPPCDPQKVPSSSQLSIQLLAIAVASRRKPFDPVADDQLGRQCAEATQQTTVAEYLRLVRAIDGVGQEAIAEAQWTLVAEFGARWRHQQR